MSTYSVRCRNSKCRHRRTSGTHPGDYKLVPRCAACGQRKGWRVEQRAYNKRGLCNCGGPVGRDGPIPHNKTHPLCDHHPEGFRNQLSRAGVPAVEIEIYLKEQAA